MNRVIFTEDADKRLQHFFSLALERQRIYFNKERLGLPKPWTKDPVFQSQFFCNVFRTQDRFTQWLMDEIVYSGNVGLWALIVVCRYYSRVDALEDVKHHEGVATVDAIYNGIRRRHYANLPIHTQGFLVGCGNEEMRRWRMPFYWIETLEAERVDFTSFKRLEDAWNVFTRLKWCGPFLAYEFVTDFSYSDRLLAHAEDIQTWSNPGPGAKRGMRRILLGSPEARISDELNVYADFSICVLERWKVWGKALYENSKEEQEIAEKFAKDLTMREVEHWLCEYDKYCRGGTSKRRYNGYGE
jgi:hypothetical protein